MAIPIEQYLVPCSSQPPCGSNDWDNLAIEGILGPMLDSIVGGSDNGMVSGERASQGTGDWSGLLAEIGGYFGRTKHLGLAWYATVADLRISGLEGLANGLVLFNQLLSRYWLDVYPRIEDGDFEERLELISRIDDPLIASGIDAITVAKGRRAGSYTLAQCEKSQASGEPAPSLIEGSINETLVEDPEFYDQLAAQVREIRQQFGFLRDIIQEHLGTPAVSFPKIEERLSVMENFLTRSAVVPGGEIPEAGASDETGSTTSPVATAAKPGEIRNRADVCRAIDQIIRFYRRTEPTSPVPYLLNRAKRAVNMDFLQLVQEFRLSGSPSLDDVFGQMDDLPSDN